MGDLTLLMTSVKEAFSPALTTAASPELMLDRSGGEFLHVSQIFMSVKTVRACRHVSFRIVIHISNLRQILLGGDQSSDLLLRVDGKTRVVSPEITSVVRVLCNVVGHGISGDEGLGLTTNVVFQKVINVFVNDRLKNAVPGAARALFFSF